MPSLLDEALALKAKKAAKAEREKRKGKTSLSQELIERLRIHLKNMPNTFEMLYTYYDVNIGFTEEEIVEIVLENRDSDPMFYEINIGDPSANLIQEKNMASRDQGCTTEPMYQAWAIKFANVYGLDVYFIPYHDPKKGFAITVRDIDLADQDEDSATTFFPHDIYKKFAISQMAKHV
jgi:hypothetical protein